MLRYVEVQRDAYTAFVEDVAHELHLPSLADGGVLLLPCFRCEYNGRYRCFISGINGQVIGTGLLEEARMADRSARLNAERHRRWLDQSKRPAGESFWQAEVDRVRAAVAPAGEGEQASEQAAVPKINLGKSQLREQISEATGSKNKQAAKTLGAALLMIGVIIYAPGFV